MAKENKRIKKEYYICLRFKDKGVEKHSVIKLLTVVISKRGYKPRTKKDDCDKVARIELQDLYQLFVMMNENIKDTGKWMAREDMIMLYRNNLGELDLRRDRDYIRTSLLHFETDIELDKLDKLLEECRRSIMESITVNIPYPCDHNTMIYQEDVDNFPLPVGRLPVDLGITDIQGIYLPPVDRSVKFTM